MESNPMAAAGLPPSLHAIAILSLAIGIASALLVVADLTRHPQRMWVMNLVWPLVTLFGSLVWLAAYWRWGRQTAPDRDEDEETPLAIAAFKGSCHCGAGCSLGDLIAEWTLFALPGIAVWFGWHGLFADKMFAGWVFDFVIAFLLGVGFQYFTIAPMRDLSPAKGLAAAVKADAASITSWQVGMYGAMAAIQLAWFEPLYGRRAEVDSVEFWFAMQLAMLAGFVTAYPVNWLLIRAGIKERM